MAGPGKILRLAPPRASDHQNCAEHQPITGTANEVVGQYGFSATKGCSVRLSEIDGPPNL